MAIINLIAHGLINHIIVKTVTKTITLHVRGVVMIYT